MEVRNIDPQHRPRLGFAGIGWIGRNRMQAMLATGAVEAVALLDTSAELAREAQALAPEATIVSSYDELLAQDLDGVVIATPSALHAEESIAALKSGKAVFCQKPLGRNLDEVEAVIEAARTADRLLGVDLSYRKLRAVEAITEKIRQGAIGQVFAADLIFHNAYGPNKDWFYNPNLSGGGCVIDLGVHLVDLALQALGTPEVNSVSGRLYAGGRPLTDRSARVEDFAVALIDAGEGVTINLACSWNLSAGQDAVISAAFYGTEGALYLRNSNGSFYDFTAELARGTSREALVSAPDDWGGRMAAAWASQLAMSAAYDPTVEDLRLTTRVLDCIYESAGAPLTLLTTP